MNEMIVDRCFSYDFGNVLAAPILWVSNDLMTCADSAESDAQDRVSVWVRACLKQRHRDFRMSAGNRFRKQRMHRAIGPQADIVRVCSSSQRAEDNIQISLTHGISQPSLPLLPIKIGTDCRKDSQQQKSESPEGLGTA